MKSPKIKKFVKLISTFSVITAIPLVDSACSQTKVLQATLISDTPDWKNGGFLNDAYDGMMSAKKSLAKEGIDLRVTYPQTVANSSTISLNNAFRAAIINGSKIIVCAGITYLQTLQQMASYYKNIYFVMIDGAAHSSAKNIYNFQFPEHEAGYLTGLLNGLMAKLDGLGSPDSTSLYGKQHGKEYHFSSIGAAAISPIKRYIWGFRIGLAYINDNKNFDSILKDAKINLSASQMSLANSRKIIYSGSKYLNFNFTNANDEGSITALNDYANGIDTIFEVAGGTGPAVIGAAKRFNITTAGHPTRYVVGVDSDLYKQGVYNSGGKSYSVVINSAVKSVKLSTSKFLYYIYTHGPLGNHTKFPKTNEFVPSGDSAKNPASNIALIQNKEVGTNAFTHGLVSSTVQSAYNFFYVDRIENAPIIKGTVIDLSKLFIWPDSSIFGLATTFYSQDLNITCKEENGKFSCKP